MAGSLAASDARLSSPPSLNLSGTIASPTSDPSDNIRVDLEGLDGLADKLDERAL